MELTPQGALVIPRRWREVLMKLKQGGFNEAIVAGGALRDLLHGREIKDIDIWVIDRGYDTKLSLDMALGVTTECKLDPNHLVVTEEGEYDGAMGSDVKGIYEFSDGGAWKFQIMTMRSDHPDTFTYDTVSRFDIGLCRIWSEDGVSIQADHFYRQDAVAKTLTIVYAPTPEAMARSMARVERLLKKYPDWTWTASDVTAPKEEEPF